MAYSDIVLSSIMSTFNVYHFTLLPIQYSLKNSLPNYEVQRLKLFLVFLFTLMDAS